MIEVVTMEIKDRRSIKHNRLLLKRDEYSEKAPLLALDAKPLENVTTLDQFYRIKGNQVHFDLPSSRLHMIIDLPQNHIPLLVVNSSRSRFGVIHTDNKKLYITFRQKFGESKDYIEEEKTFDLGSPERVQVFDKAVAFTNRTGKWQVLPQALYTPSLDQLNQTQFKDLLRERYPYLDPKKFGELYGVMVSEYEPDYVAVVTDKQLILHVSGTSKFRQEFLKLNDEQKAQIQRAIDKSEPFKGTFTTNIGFLIGKQLQVFHAKLSSSYIRVQFDRTVDDVDEIYQDTNSAMIVKRGKSLYFVDHADAADSFPDLVKDSQLGLSRLDKVQDSLLHIQYVSTIPGATFVLQYPTSLQVIAENDQAKQEVIRRLLQHRDAPVPRYMPIETYKKLLDMFPELTKEGSLC